MTIKTKFNIARGALLFWCLFICIGAIGGAILLGVYRSRCPALE